MKRLLNYFSTAELLLWGFSVLAILVSFFGFEQTGYLSLAGSLIGVTSLIFCAKGHPLGMALGIVFSIIYSIISYSFAYYGEMITYLGMTMPMSVLSLVSWLRHPHKESHAEVEVGEVRGREYLLLGVLTVGITVGFYFILRVFGTANLIGRVALYFSFVLMLSLPYIFNRLEKKSGMALSGIAMIMYFAYYLYANRDIVYGQISPEDFFTTLF